MHVRLWLLLQRVRWLFIGYMAEGHVSAGYPSESQRRQLVAKCCFLTIIFCLVSGMEPDGVNGPAGRLSEITRQSRSAACHPVRTQISVGFDKVTRLFFF